MKEGAIVKIYSVLGNTVTSLGFVNPKGFLWDGLQGMFSQQPLHYIRAVAGSNDIKLLVEDI